MRGIRAAIVVLAAFNIVSNVHADVVRLRGGGELNGVCREEGEKIVLEMNIGTSLLAKEEVEYIKKVPSTLHVYFEKYGTVTAGAKPAEIFAFLRWAEGEGITRDRKILLTKVIELDPNHEDARKMLGYERYEGKWLTKDEAMRAKGYVRYEGRWMSAAEKEALVGKAAEAKLKAELARLQTELRTREERESKERAKREAQIASWVEYQMGASRYNQRQLYRTDSDFPWWMFYEPFASYAHAQGNINPVLMGWYPRPSAVRANLYPRSAYAFYGYSYPYPSASRTRIYALGTVYTPAQYFQ